MRWAPFFHFYQPADQQPDILEAVVAQSYRPLLNGFKKQKKTRLTLNITGALLELFDKYKYRDLIDILRELGKAGRIEFTSSSKYHAILPFLDKEEIARQIRINDETNKFFLGGAYAPRGFFPPEMAYDNKLDSILIEMGFNWVILDEIACGGEVGKIDYTKIYTIKGKKLDVFFRERRLSNLIMSSVVRSRETLIGAMQDDLRSDRYVITAMDGETFGHHRPGLEKMLFDIFAAPECEFIRISDIRDYYKKTVEILPAASTWASSEQDIKRGIQFISWADPENIIHQWQKEFTELVLHEVQSMDKQNPQYAQIRAQMDKALSSDHFFWACAKPWWSVEMIELGAYLLLSAIRQIPDVSQEKLAQATVYYEKIISTAFEWQRTKKIWQMMRDQGEALRIPFKERTLEKGGAEKGVYHAFIQMMKRLEREARKRGEYEQAILWRDAVYKLQHKHDVYDTINVIDLLRTKIPHDEVEKTLDRYTDQYRKIRGGQPEQRG